MKDITTVSTHQAYNAFKCGKRVYAIERKDGERGDIFALTAGTSYYMEVERNGELDANFIFWSWYVDACDSMEEFDLFIEQGNYWGAAKDEAVTIIEKAVDATGKDFEEVLEFYEECLEYGGDIIKTAEEVARLVYNDKI